MPITDENDLSDLLANGRITALTVDTNIFDQKKLQFTSPALQAVTRIRRRRFGFILSGTVVKEVERHLVNSKQGALSEAKKALGSALAAFDTQAPTRDALLALITDGQTPELAAQFQFSTYLRATDCNVLEDAKLVSTEKIFGAYFAGVPPFGSKSKKSEFPDALALNALECFAQERDTSILVVSKDGDWRSFCEVSPRLHLIADLERALSLITAPPVVLREAAQAWIEGSEGRDELEAFLRDAVEGLEFSVYGHATAGDMETNAWAGELQNIKWPKPEEIDVIEVQSASHDFTTLILSIPLLLQVKVPIELEFSTWDSIDRETVGLGSRLIHVEKDLDLRATINLKIGDPGGDNEMIKLVSCELDDLYPEIDIGQVDVFDRENDWT